MKNTFTFLTAVLLSAFVFLPQQSIAQVPDKISYQAVIRDANNLLATNWNIGMQISVLQGSASGQDVFVERHFPTTNANGLASIEIGTGVLVSGDFASIDWSDGTYFIKSETDLNGGANYTIIGTSQILSVPYALHARVADSVINNGVIVSANSITDADGDTKIQVEATPDEDSIRFDIDGLQYFGMGKGRFEVLNSGKSVYIGQGAGANDDLTDHANVAVGFETLPLNTTGSMNTAIGYTTLWKNITGSWNVAIGSRSLYSTTTGENNIAVGGEALFYNISGDINTAIGNQSLHNNTTGNANTAIGRSSLKNNTLGDENTAIGRDALYYNSTGYRNTAIGHNSQVSPGSLTNATAIGANAIVNQDNSIVLGSINGVNGASSDVNVGIGTTSPNESAILELNSSSKGFLPPRMTVTQRDAIFNPSDGLIIFNTTSKQINVCVAGAWYVVNMVATSVWLTVFNPATGRTWMDRNLGAAQVATGSGDILAFGDLYQWGRFSDGHENRTSNTTNTLATTPEPNQGIGWDGLFITTNTPPYDWLSSQTDSLWQGVNGFNNPCPAGFRIPTKAEWEAERQSWLTNDAAGALNSPLKLPIAGYRSHIEGIFWYNLGSYACSTISGADTYRLWFSNSDAYMINDSNRATGISVRCIKEE